jgi:hypothetical protein
LYQRNWEKQRVIDGLHVLEWLMRLPNGLEQQIWLEIKTIKEGEIMRYLSRVELSAPFSLKRRTSFR